MGKHRMSNAERHHPWCNFFPLPREGCKMCGRLFRDYPLREGESVAEMIGREFPDAKIIPKD